MLSLAPSSHTPTTTNSYSPPSNFGIQYRPVASPCTGAPLNFPPVNLALVELPGMGIPTVPVVPLGVLMCSRKDVPLSDHLDENWPLLVEKPASTCERSPSWGTMAHVAPASLRIWMPPTKVYEHDQLVSSAQGTADMDFRG